MKLAERLFRGEISSHRITKRYVKKSGEIIWVNQTAYLLQGGSGMPAYGVAMIEDVTEIKRGREETLARQKLESVGTSGRRRGCCHAGRADRS
jgi:PAS domain S-box-containing protein